MERDYPSCVAAERPAGDALGTTLPDSNGRGSARTANRVHAVPPIKTAPRHAKTSRHASEGIIEQINPRGETIYWIGPAGDAKDAGEGTDFHATANGQVSITPLQVDLTDHAGLGAWAQRLGA